MGCNNLMTEEYDKLIEKAMRGETCFLDPEIERELMPEIREAHNARSLELLEENSDNARERIEEQVAQKGEVATDLDKITREVWPTHQQLHEMVVIGEKLGISETEIISVPLICVTPEAKDAETVIHDMLWAIQNQDKIPYWHKDDTVFSKIVFVGEKPIGLTGPKSADFDPNTKVLFIYRKPDGDFPTKEEIKNDIVPHEVFHGNREEFMGRIREHRSEWKAMKAFDGVTSSKYSMRLYELAKEGMILDERVEEEIAAELYRDYINNRCLKTTAQFFDKYFSE